MGAINKTDRVTVRYLGMREYSSIFQKMKAFTEQRTDSTTDEIWLLEHLPVFTQGRNGKAEHILDAGDIPVIPIDRGGQITYHGPGQLVAYLLLDIRRKNLGVRKLVTLIETALISFLATKNITAESKADAPGVYVQGKKIAALGLRVSKGRCYHGLSLNIDMDLSAFQRINPCGYQGLEVTQCQDLGFHTTVKLAADDLITNHFAPLLGSAPYYLNES